MKMSSKLLLWIAGLGPAPEFVNVIMDGCQYRTLAPSEPEDFEIPPMLAVPESRFVGPDGRQWTRNAAGFGRPNESTEVYELNLRTGSVYIRSECFARPVQK